MRRPVVGISTYYERATWGPRGLWQREAALLPRTYVDTAARAGTTPVLLPPVGGELSSEEQWEAAAAAIDAVDALVLSGGADVHPHRYGAEPDAALGPTQPGRDAWEVMLFQQALRRRLPVLGVCRGMQLLTVALGGTLHQHLPDRVGHTRHQPVPGTFGTVAVRVEPSSRVAAIVGTEAKVACHHHQAVADLTDTELVPVAWAEDGTVEAVELARHGFVLGVQWHPEERIETALFEALRDAALTAAAEAR